MPSDPDDEDDDWLDEPRTRILRMTYTVADKKFKLTLDIHGELFKMGDMSKSNNTGMKNIDPTPVGYSHYKSPWWALPVFDNVDCDESCDGFTIEQIDFIRMLEKQREVMIDQYNSEGVELFDNSTNWRTHTMFHPKTQT